MDNCNTNHLYVASFTAGGDSGLALMAASSERTAISILKNSGRYNGEPSKYSIIQIRDIGLSSGLATELLLESYINALVAYDAIMSVVNKYVGPKGDKGDKGDPVKLKEVDAEVDPNIGTPEVTVTMTGDDFEKSLVFSFKNLKGDTGPIGPTGPPVSIANNLETDTPRLALSAAMGVQLKSEIDETNRKLGGASYVGDIVTTVDAPIKHVKDSDGNEFYPVTHESAVRDSEGIAVGVKIANTNAALDNQSIVIAALQSSVGALSTNDTVLAWDGSSAPVVSNIPAGVVVSYNGTDYTGTLQASSSTHQKTYLIGNEDDDTKKQYVTVKNGSTYYWVPFGSTDVDFSEYQRKDDEIWLSEEDFDALVDAGEIDPTKTYNVYEEVSEI